uniref:Pentatricopeptide repeat-containing protein n=1 Tax=Cannabis sativa TaxID=3483 RepID=A0A803P788_CANSA
MLKQGVEPNCFTFSALLKDCPLGHGKLLHGQARFDFDLYVRTGLIDVYARAGDVCSAQQLFVTMPKRSLVSLTAMMTCYAKHGKLDELSDV